MIAAEGLHLDGNRDNSDRTAGSLTLHGDKEFGDTGQLVKIGGRFYGAEYGSAGPIDNPTPDARQSYKKGSIDGRLKGPWGDIGKYSFRCIAIISTCKMKARQT